MNLQNKKCLFLVQGEGRGHMTQSIAMKQILEEAGMKVCEVILGRSNHREIPEFYKEKMKIKITGIISPNMVLDHNNKKIKPFSTFLKSAYMLPIYFKNLGIIHKKVKEHKPDVIINFFEPLSGFYFILFRPRMPIISVAHHFMFLHSDYKMPEGYSFESASLKFYTWLTSIGSKKRLALSFYPFENDTKKSILVVPPLLRKEVLDQKVEEGNYVLVYLLNSGYAEDIIKWHNENPETELHCFTDKKNMAETEQFDSTLFFHRIDDKKFLSMMANSMGVVTTSGFESVNEAMYMGKPVFMVPVEGHFEQFCNSCDAARTSLALSSKKFEITRFLNHIDNFHGSYSAYIEWVKKSNNLIIRNIYSVLNEGDNVKQLYPELTMRKSQFKMESI